MAPALHHSVQIPFPLVKDVTSKSHADTTCYYKTKRTKKKEKKI